MERERARHMPEDPTESGLRVMHGDGEHVAPLFDPDDERSSPSHKRLYRAALAKFQILTWIHSYNRYDAASDVRAGLTVSVILIPQAIAYALLVEVDPVVGLYASFVPLIVFALFTTSKHMSIGPFALISLVVASVANGLVPAESTDAAEYLGAVLTLSLLTGVVQIVMGLLGLGVIASFLADPCIAGFTTAVALIIMSSQLKYLLGIPISKGSMPVTIYRALVAFFTGNVNWWAFLVCVSAFALMYGLKTAGQRFCKKVPLFEQLIAVVFFTGVNYGANIPVDSIGVLPKGLPAPQMPALPSSLALWGSYAQGAVVIAFTAFLVSMSMARIFGAKHDYPVDANQELIALGSANFLGGIFGAFPVSGSFSRSAVVSSLGGRTPMHGIVQAAVIMLVLLWLTPLFRTLPYAVLAAIIFTALQSLVDFSSARVLWKSSRPDFALWIVAFLTTALFDVQVGLVVSLAASLGLLVLRTSRPRWVVLGRLPGTDIWRDVTRYPSAEVLPHVLVCRFDAPLHFANAEHFIASLHKRLRVMAKTGDEPTHVVLDCSSIHTLDASANSKLKQLLAELQKKNIAFVVANSRAPFREALEKFGLLPLIGENYMFLSLLDAVEKGCSQPRQPPVMFVAAERTSDGVLPLPSELPAVSAHGDEEHGSLHAQPQPIAPVQSASAEHEQHAGAPSSSTRMASPADRELGNVEVVVHGGV